MEWSERSDHELHEKHVHGNNWIPTKWYRSDEEMRSVLHGSFVNPWTQSWISKMIWVLHAWNASIMSLNIGMYCIAHDIP